MLLLLLVATVVFLGSTLMQSANMLENRKYARPDAARADKA
jgi:hypothetical protein